MFGIPWIEAGEESEQEPDEESMSSLDSPSPRSDSFVETETSESNDSSNQSLSGSSSAGSRRAAASRHLRSADNENYSRALQDGSGKTLLCLTLSLIEKGAYRQLKNTLWRMLRDEDIIESPLLTYLSSALLAQLACLKINIEGTTQGELDEGELEMRGNAYAMLHLRVHVLKLWAPFGTRKHDQTPYNCLTLTDVTNIDPLEKSPKASFKIRYEVRERLAREYVHRLRNDEAFAAHQEAVAHDKVNRMRAMDDFLRRKPTAFERAGFVWTNLQQGQADYPKSLTEVIESAIANDGGDFELWLESCTNAMKVLSQNKLRCQHYSTFIHRSIAVNAVARLAEKLKQEMQEPDAWGLGPEDMTERLLALFKGCYNVLQIMYTPDRDDDFVDVPSNYILHARLAAVAYAFAGLVELQIAIERDEH
ncbi:hypothetical protein KC361_g2696 [Hortaea werneckii]|nr:hypothetical protein KC361_g2696 [Hortaea werneckii]